MNLCRCGCGNFCKKLFKRGHNHKNKSYESIYGKERANEIKKVISLKTKIFQSQPYEIKWGKEVAEKVKQERAEKIRQRCLGKTKIELYGEEHAKKIIDTQKKKISKSYEEHFGLEKALEIKQKQSLSKKVWTKEKIIDAFKNINKTFGKIQRCEIKNYAKKGLICYEQAIVNEVGSLDMLVNLSG